MELVKNEDRWQLHCGHVFHRACLQPWAQETNSCPNCRKPIDPAHEAKRLNTDAADEDEVYEMMQEVMLEWLAQVIMPRVIPMPIDIQSYGQCSHCLAIRKKTEFLVGTVYARYCDVHCAEDAQQSGLH